MTLPTDPDSPKSIALRRANATIPREALERVLARATQLQSDGSDAPEVLSEARLLEIAREVGIDAGNLQQALAEERARVPLATNDQGAVLDALGPATLSAQRVVPGTPAEILAKLEGWMPRMEAVTVRRRIGDRISWEPRHDALGNFLRSLGMGGRRFDLVRLDQVVASVTAVDATRSVVRFDIESRKARRTQRNTFIATTAGMGLIGIGVATLLALVAGGPTIAGAGAAALAGFVGLGAFVSWRTIRKGYRDMLGRAHLRLEQLLDDLEGGGMQPPPSIARQVTAALLR